MSKSPQGKPQSRNLDTVSAYLLGPHRHTIALAAVFLSLVVFFYPMIFQGKIFIHPDTTASHSWDTMAKEADSAGIFPLWNPYIFCGMPAYGSLTLGGARNFDISGKILSIVDNAFQLFLLDSDLGWVIFFYFVFAVGIYILIDNRLKNSIAALVGSLGAVYSMFTINWIMAGHNTKIAVIAFFPFVVMVVEKLREKFDIRYALGLVLLLHFMLLAGHVQMIFYVYFSLVVYFVYYLVASLLKKENLTGVLRSAGILIAASALAFALDSDKYLSVLEYNPYSMRGAAPLIPSVQKGENKTLEGGLDYDYATSWSFGVGEVMTFLVPTWYGFGQLTYHGPLAKDFVFNAYFGPQTFTEAAQYLGIVILFLAVVGFVRNRSNPFVRYLGITIILSLLVAFGREFPILYDPMFKFVPGFNKFRIPSMILVLAQVFVPVLAAYGVASLMAQGDRGLDSATETRWKRILYAVAAFFALTIVVPGFFKGIYTSIFPLQEVGGHLAASVGSRQMEVVTEIYNFVVDTVMTDIRFAAAFLLIAFGAFFFYWKRSIQAGTLAVILVVVVLADLWRVDERPMEPRDRADQTHVFTAPPYVDYLRADTTLFRTLLFVNGQPPYDNTLAYWKIQSAYGYQGAKMRAYQDIVDVAGLGNPLVWQLMNVKYIISNKPDSSGMLALAFDGPEFKVYRFRAAMPRAFFVKRFELATAKEIVNKMAGISFSPEDVAYMTVDPKVTVDPPDEHVTAEYVHYGIQDLEVRVHASGNNLLFLSESYYAAGWKAFLDGNEIPIYCLDYFFRGVIVPAGDHTLRMTFEPRGFYLGKKISLGTNILVLASLAGAVVLGARKKKTAHPIPPAPPGASTQPPTA